MPNIKLKVNPTFLPYINCTKKYQVYWGGAGSGKSVFIAQRLTLLLLKEKRKLLVARAVFNTHRESTFEEFKQCFQRMGIMHLMKIKESDLTITFPNGSKIIFRGTDGGETKLLSLSGVSVVWCEEAFELSKELVDQLYLRVRMKDVQEMFFFSFNPINEDSWVKKHLVENPEIIENGVIHHSTYLDNKFLSESYIQRIEAMRTTNPSKYRIFGEGLWGITGELVFNNWEEQAFDDTEIIKKYPKVKALYGLDWGFKTDPSAFVYLLIDEGSKQIWICDEMYKRGLLNDEIADWLINHGYANAPIVADSAEQKSIADLKRNGIRRIRAAKKGKGSINAGIDFLSQFKIYIHPSCVGTLKEFGLYAYKKNKDGKFTNEPLDKNNHSIDCIRYAVEELIQGKGQVKTINKKILGI